MRRLDTLFSFFFDSDMAIPDEIHALILRLNQELSEVEQLATEGINIVYNRLDRFPNNTILIQIFAYFNNSILLVENLRRHIEYSKLILATNTANLEQIQEAGEDLSERLGQVLEAKVGVITVKTRLENWS